MVIVKTAIRTLGYFISLFSPFIASSSISSLQLSFGLKRVKAKTIAKIHTGNILNRNIANTFPSIIDENENKVIDLSYIFLRPSI